RGVLWWLGIDLGLRLLRPFLGLGQALLQLADTGEVLVELLAIVTTEGRLHLLGLVADRVEDAAAIPQPPGLGLDFVGTTFEEQPREDARWETIRRHTRAAAGPGETKALTRQRQAGIARRALEVLGRDLVY